MELDGAFRSALILSWGDLRDAAKTCSLRLEYEKELKTAIDHISVWADQPKGYQFLICNFWTTSTAAHPSGARFANGYHSDQLVRGLGFIMANQKQFTRAADAGRNGLILIYTPTAEDHAEAARWWSAEVKSEPNGG